MVEGIEALDAYYSQYLPQLVITALVPLSILLFVFPIDLLSGVVLLLTAPLIPFFMILIGKAAEALTKRQYETLSRLSAHFLDSLQGLTTLKYFGASKAHAKTIARVSDNFRDTTLGVLRVTFLSAFALELIATISTAIIALEIGLRVLYGQMPFQPALFILILAPEFYLPFRMLGLRFHAGMAGTSAAKRIYAILDAPLPPESDSGPVMTGAAPSSINFENVTYSYPGENQPALTGVSLHIPRDRGWLWSVPAEQERAHWQACCCALPNRIRDVSAWMGLTLEVSLQMPGRSRFPGYRRNLIYSTIRSPLTSGLPIPSPRKRKWRQQRIRQTCIDFIESLPDRYETIVGEAGARLSGGQAQRLALARAFLKNAPILILDEPTSSLDPEQEALLEEAVNRLMAGRTVLTIAHRLNTVFKADQIVVLEAGQVSENGTHAELLKLAGVYSRMVSRHGVGAETDAPSKGKPPPVVTPSAHHPEQTDRASKIPAPVTSRPVFLRLLGFLQGSWLG